MVCWVDAMVPMTSWPAHVDVLIVGGGPVGGALALSLANSGLEVAVIEARQRPGEDARALAVAHASQQTLAKLGIWPAQQGTAIRSVHVSQQGGFGRVKLAAADLALPALGHVLPYAALAHQVHDRLASPGERTHYLPGARVVRLQTLDGYAAAYIQTEQGEALMTARLLVLAEGGQLLQAAGLAQDEHDYGQHALVAEVLTDRPHDGVAYERFATDGPIALLPKGDRYAVVWTRPAQDLLAAAELPEAQFLAELQSRMGDRAGRFVASGPRASFPLRLKWATSHQARRLAVVGNAAQTLHPVAGQGFNLGLRDAMALSRVILATPRSQLGDAGMLTRYAELRKVDSLATVGFTDGLIRLFGVDATPVRKLRSAGFLALDNIKPMRRGFAERMVFGNS